MGTGAAGQRGLNWLPALAPAEQISQPAATFYLIPPPLHQAAQIKSLPKIPSISPNRPPSLLIFHNKPSPTTDQDFAYLNPRRRHPIDPETSTILQPLGKLLDLASEQASQHLKSHIYLSLLKHESHFWFAHLAPFLEARHSKGF